MTAAFGALESSNPRRKTGLPMLRSLHGHFFHANGVDNDDKKRSVFLSVIGPACVQASEKSSITRETGRQVLQVPDRDDDQALQPCPLQNSAEV